ncbi:hypothetical protein NIES4071_99460 [Calothrix sp. NIES-4071]|nr:hypothetical protein NIES4071_99460 [Calothrix sp. NIES-4071]BAZ64209.1 hypothetical protein NIES4105_99390 [Calothrix sp. NIES-4105]
MKPEFSAMTKAELRSYVIAHPNDNEAFYIFVDRFTSEASPETFDIPNSSDEIEKVEILIRQKLEQTKTS